MPSLYDDLFEDGENTTASNKKKQEPISFDDEKFQDTGNEALDEILVLLEQFASKAEPFSRLLSQTRAVDHEVTLGILDFFLVTKDKYDQETLAKERTYYGKLQGKFTAIIEPMRNLAELHLKTVKRFNQDIDTEYYSIEKSQHEVKSDKKKAITGINIQRKILAEAATSLSILEVALERTEKRIRQYIDAGGINNISNAECEILAQKRMALTSGQLHRFDYSFFKMNFVDKTAIAMGVYLKETTSQYLNKLDNVFIKA